MSLQLKALPVILARAYQQSFDSHPYFTLAFTNATLSALGDLVAQTVQIIAVTPTELHQTRYDVPRTVRFFCFGFGMGPLIGRWNNFLEHSFPLKILGRSRARTSRVDLTSLTKRVSCDQLIMAPIGLAMFLGSMGIMEGHDKTHIRAKFSDIYNQALLANWKVWPLAQLINFRFMPLPYRVPFQSTCGVFWTLYLSLLNSNEEAKQKHTDSMREK